MNNSPEMSKHIRKKGGIREMIEIAMPMVVSQACYTIMTFTDRMFLSRLSPELMNAAMGGGLTIFVMMTFFLGLTGYATALVAQYYGSGNKKKLCTDNIAGYCDCLHRLSNHIDVPAACSQIVRYYWHCTRAARTAETIF